VVKVNVDEEKDLAVAYKVSSIPKLVFLKDGEEVDQIVGLQGESALQEKVNTLNGFPAGKVVVYDENDNAIGAQG
jgi:thioredoxin 1